jgi:hypothetical protein
VIDGYTVQEAASVLGVPEGRVWELLARGVISGTPEGDSMRVHLKARAEPMVATHEPSPRSNGNGGSNGGAEASAFRELLTEFRNLTERYGQALLALGEARGEVAGLRSRVELLESRLDLRLPGQPTPAPVSWTAPEADAESAAPAPATAPAEERLAERRTRKPSDRKPKPSATAAAQKAPRRRAAVAGIAEALARAEDPSPAELPERSGQSVRSQRPGEQVAEPEPPPSVAPTPPAAASPYSTEVVEPDWFADGDFAWLDAAEHTKPEPPQQEPAAVVEVEAAAGAELAEVEAQVVAEELAVAELESAPGGYPEPITATEPEEPTATVLTLSEEELAQLASDEGWGASEVEAIRGLIGSEVAPAPIELPGGDELDAAMAALEATPREEQWSKPSHEAEPIDLPEPVSPPVVSPPAAVSATAPLPRATSNEPAWLRRRRGPAAAAFRALRRLLPG